MSDTVKITQFHIENVKRVKAVAYEPAETGLTVIGGANGQGKTSVIDALAWGLGGGKLAPSAPARDGALSTPEIDITLNNGVRVQRKGKNAALVVTDENGNKAGQALLDAFVSELAVCLPKFMNASSKDKLQIVLKAIGIEEELAQIERDEARIYADRTAVGRIADQKKKYADGLPVDVNAPDEYVDINNLVAKLREANAINNKKTDAQRDIDKIQSDLQRTEKNIDDLRARLDAELSRLRELGDKQKKMNAAIAEMREIDISAIEAELESANEINKQVDARYAKLDAIKDAEAYQAQYDGMTKTLEALRTRKFKLLDGHNMPLPGLSVEHGELQYNGKQWDCMSSAEQLRVATSFLLKLKPECGFVFVDRLEVMDIDTLRGFSDWAISQNLQVIGTRVSSGDECSIIICDGMIQEEKP